MKFKLQNRIGFLTGFQGHGFSLVEIIVGVAVFLIVVTAAYGSYTSLFQLAHTNQSRLLALALADEEFEIIRNMPYVNVGLTNGIPQGNLLQTQTITRGGVDFTLNLTIRNMNLSTSTLQASSKLIEVEIDCATCQNFQPVYLTGQVAPANLQSASTGGALAVSVLDADGHPVSGATIDMTNTASSSVQDHDVTNNGGVLDIVGVPQGLNSYHVVASKAGYSSEQTYASGLGNPNPTKPDVTILTQQVTPLTLSIDHTASLHISSVTPMCAPVGGIHFSLAGTKVVGTNNSGAPIFKYNQNFVTNGVGTFDLPSLEWDTYVLTPTDSFYDVAGITPLSPFVINPGNSQNVQIVVAPRQANSLMVTVVDNATQLPLSGATVHLTGAGGVDKTLITGQGFMNQADWSAGSGQDNLTNPSKYFADDGGVDTSLAGTVKLKNSFGSYASFGRLESSTFDTGSVSNFYTLSWNPTSQPADAGANSLKFQLASNSVITATTTWNYVGPDGTDATYYTTNNSPIAGVHNGNEFMRYLALFSTAVATSTPILSGVSFTYTSSCIPPGQVMFSGLSTGLYNITVSRGGYTSWSGSVNISSGWQSQTINLGP